MQSGTKIEIDPDPVNGRTVRLWVHPRSRACISWSFTESTSTGGRVGTVEPLVEANRILGNPVPWLASLRSCTQRGRNVARASRLIWAGVISRPAGRIVIPPLRFDHLGVHKPAFAEAILKWSNPRRGTLPPVPVLPTRRWPVPRTAARPGSIPRRWRTGTLSRTPAASTAKPASAANRSPPQFFQPVDGEDVLKYHA